jgi:hypothetical protein
MCIAAAGLLICRCAQVNLRTRQYEEPEWQLSPGARNTIAEMLYVAGRGDMSFQRFQRKNRNMDCSNLFSNAGLTSMGSSQERAELEAKLARCRDLAREFREGPTADMIRDLETEICESLQRLADAADLADPADDLENGPLPRHGMGDRRLR